MKRGNTWVVAAGVGLLSLVSVGFLAGCSPADAVSDETDKLFVARRSNLAIGTMLRGTANAKEKHKLFAEASTRCKLIWIEEENSYVNKGDVVIRFETQELLDSIEERKASIESKEKSLEIKKEERRILLSENQSSLRVAADRVETAKENYSRYYKYDGKKAKDDLVRSVDGSEKAYQEAKEKHREKLDEISNTIYDNEAAKQAATTQLDQLKAMVELKDRAYETARFNLKIFKKYTYPNTLTTKLNALEQAELNLDKVQVSTESRVVQKDEDILRSEKDIRRVRKDLNRLEGYLPLMEIVAPVDGILVYGDADRKGGHQRVEIEVGMECYRNRVLATIPDMEHLIVNFEIPEQFRHRMGKDASAVITPDSIPSLKIKGRVSDIAVVPVHQISWDNTSPKVYHSKITLDQQNESLVSGMNVQIEIIEETLEQVVNVPVEAVFEEEGEYFVYLKKGGRVEKQIVVLGKSNDQYVHITAGLDEGENVYLYSPFKLDAAD